MRLSIHTADPVEAYPVAAVAERFARARRTAASLPDFPGPLPTCLDVGYQIQDAALSLWDDEVVGWKVGRVPAVHEVRLGKSRIFGPVFRRGLQHVAPGSVTPFPVFVGGFAAVEAEYVVRIGHDAPADKREWSLDEAAELIGAMHIGMEPAGSPLATINILGPTAVVSDFGNNAGLMVGQEIPDWRERSLDELRCETLIAGQVVGQGGAFLLPGGPVQSLRLLAENLAQRGRPLKQGMLICTGAAAGIHDIVAGQEGAVRFDGYGEIRCAAVAATA